MMRVINLKQASILKRKQRRCEPIRTKYKKQDHFSLVVLFFYGKKAVSRSRQLENYEVNIQKKLYQTKRNDILRRLKR